MRTDSLFYRLFQHWPELVLNLLAIPSQGMGYEFVSEEIKQTGFRLDGIFKPLDTNPDQPIIFIEVQFQPDEDFYGRFYSEIMLYLYRHKPNRPWLALVLYPGRSTEKLPRIEFAYALDLPQCQRIYLEDYQHSTNPNHALFRLIACPESETASFAQALTAQSATLGQNVIEFIETVLVYKLPNLSREEIRAMLGLNNVELKQTRFYQEIAEEERLEGRQEGRLQGRQEGEVLLLTRLLAKRFAPLPEWVGQKLQQAETGQLESWTERILDAQSVDDVFK